MLLDQVVYPATVAATAGMGTVAIVVSGAHVADSNIFNKLIARGVLEAIKSEPLTVKNALILHLLAMGWTESHHGALETIAARYGIPRETMGRATKRLVELDLLAKRDRGRIEPHRTRPAEYRVTERIEIITAECVFGMNLFKDFFASITDIFGGRSKSSQKVLRDARMTCLAALRREALMVGANAVIGMDLAYNEISGDGKSMLFLVASGTAVTVEPK